MSHPTAKTVEEGGVAPTVSAVPTTAGAKAPMTSASLFATMEEKKAVINMGLRAAQALFAVIGIICLATTDFRFFTYAYGGGTGFYYFAAATTLIGSILILVLPKFVTLPKNFPIIVLCYDFVYAWFWLGSSGSIASISSWCLTWQSYGYSTSLNCGGLGGAAAFGFFMLFAFIGSIVMGLLPVLAGKVRLADFLNGRDAPVEQYQPSAVYVAPAQTFVPVAQPAAAPMQAVPYGEPVPAPLQQQQQQQQPQYANVPPPSNTYA
ncbi:hypothetical protein HDU67_007536 [Dinochytrium kinnereticum]|nr:hypothetical protein HDU67_007536 [Dinochytrium kinnereticum]